MRFFAHFRSKWLILAHKSAQNQRKFFSAHNNTIMASVKLSLSKAKKKDNTYPLYFIISHNGSSARIPAGVSLEYSNWDDRKRQVVDHPQKRTLNISLSEKKLDIERAIESIKGQRAMTATQLKDRVAKILDGGGEQGGLFGQFFCRVVDTYDNKRTRELYKATWIWIEKYDDAADDLTFDEITTQWLQGFERAMRGTSANSKSIHLRNIRAVFNKAINEGLTEHYPFRRYKIKSEKTRKRSMDVEKLHELLTMPAPLPHQERYLDFFRLQFFLIGINTIDLIHNARLVDGRVEYRRAKTKRLYSIKAEPEALALIEKYKGEDKLISVSFNKDYRTFMRHLNDNLQKIAGITTYWGRHTWATIAASLDIPKDTIAAALGHGGNTVTDIYIDFDQRKVDEANRKVIDYVLYNNIER